MSVTLIWAMSSSGVIGKDNKLPWRMPADMAYFKQQTLGKTVIMGRKTWESFGAKPLKDRRNIVLTRDKHYTAEGGEVLYSVSAVQNLFDVQDELMIIGGAEIYKQWLPFADRLKVTIIEGEFEGDTSFPDVNWSEFELVEEVSGVQDERNPYPYRFMTYERVKAAAQ